MSKRKLKRRKNAIRALAYVNGISLLIIASMIDSIPNGAIPVWIVAAVNIVMILLLVKRNFCR